MRTPESKKKLGRKLVSARVMKNLSADALAERIGKSISAVRSWEAGRFAPRHADMVKLAEVLDKPVSWFYGETEEEQPDQAQVKIGDATITADAETIERIIAGLRKEPLPEYKEMIEAGPDPGVIELLGNDELCRQFKITDQERTFLTVLRGGFIKSAEKALTLILSLRD